MRSEKMITICQDRQLCTTSLDLIIVRQGLSDQFFDLSAFSIKLDLRGQSLPLLKKNTNLKEGNEEEERMRRRRE